MEAIEEFWLGDFKVRILPDTDPESPCEWDTLGTIVYWKNSRYVLGCKAVSREEMDEIASRKDVVRLPVYAYVHGGSTISTEPFGDPWDSGQSGLIYAEDDKVKKEYGVKKITPAIRRKAEDVLRAEVKEFSKYLEGDVYGIVIEDSEGEVVESVWGFYGIEYAREEARRMAESLQKAKEASGPRGL